MPFLFLLLFLLSMASVLFARRQLTRSRPADYEAIDEFLAVREKTRTSVRMDNNYWRYWIRGKNLSNCARIYIVEVQGIGGERSEIHVAFDDWRVPSTPKMQILMER